MKFLFNRRVFLATGNEKPILKEYICEEEKLC